MDSSPDLVMGTAGMSAGERYRVIGLSILRTLASLFVIFWLLSLVPEVPDLSLTLPYGMLLVGMIVYFVYFRKQVRRIQSSRYPLLQSAEALILAAAIFLSLFAGFYVMIHGVQPGAFSEPLTHFTALYFTITVFATVGFGDITPVTDLARGFTMVQMALGLGFIGMLVKIFGTTAQRALQRRRTVNDNH
jgi:voltage-gated potassium channel